MPEVIYTYSEFQKYLQRDSLFWIIEYHDADEAHRYSLLRNECLMYPTNYKQRLENKVYRIWTVTPREIPW